VAKKQERFETEKAESASARAARPSSRARRNDRTSAQVPLLFRGDHDTLEEAARRALERRLGGLLQEPVSLTITDNRHTMMSSRRRGRVTHIRLHHMFLDADDSTVRALARYLTRGDHRSSSRLDVFIEENAHLIRKERARAAPVRTRGRYHDLRDIFDELNELWFDERIDVQVTWGRRAPTNRRRRRSVRLGTYVQDDKLIRIHPVLDQDWVPRFFVAYVLFHEMLHHVVPAPLVNGKKHFHSPEFRSRERGYPDYDMAIVWEKANLRRLLSS